MRKFDNVVKKPWGYEYVAYENEHCALWFLHIKDQHSTSMHCHPNKTTGLTLLDGGAVVSFLNNKNVLTPHHKIMIRKGLFHSTEAVDERGAWVFEIETPVDKGDLVRLRDSYGRQGQPYEDESFEYPKQGDCLWIEDPEPGKPNIYEFANSKLVVSGVSSVSFFDDVQDHKNVMFLKGGILTEYNIHVAAAGDIVSAKILKELIQVFTKVAEETVVMIMEKDD